MSETESRTPPLIGPYHVVRLIGEGGMGVVYEAEQRKPLRRRVAVKTMKVGMDTKEVIGRFESERQALAVMEHPGIAKVLDAGAAADGRPYFVMELVHGIPLDDYCDRNRLPTRERVRLFMKVCDAVQHAHLKGIIHRDLKPSNVLVEDFGGHPEPKIIDFGVAKATGHRLTEQTVVTTYGQAIGTLAYMSPEQAEMSGLDVDSRADLYSLGVVLFELLTGRVPLDPKEMGTPTFLATLVQRDLPMPTASECFGSMRRGRQREIASRRRTDVAGLMRDLRGDLQWIVAKATEKDRSRRYATANELWADLGRHLSDEPVVARPPSTLYRFRKFARRNRAATLGAGTAAMALLVGAAVALDGMMQARRAEEVALQEAATAEQVSAFLEGLFEVSDPGEARGNTITAREILEAGARRIETELGDQPAVKARLMSTMGRVFANVGLRTRGEELLRESLAIQRGGLVESPRLLARTLIGLGTLVAERGDVEGADSLVEAGTELLSDAAGLELQYASALSELGFHRVFFHGEYQAADSFLALALEIAETELGPDHPDLAPFLSNLAQFHDDDPEYAEPLQRRVLELYERSFGWNDVRTLSAGHTLYMILSGLPESADEAESLMRRVLAGTEEIYGTGHVQSARVRTDFSLLLHEYGRDAEAVEMLRPAVAIFGEALGEDAPETAWCRHHLARSLLKAGSLDEGRDQLQRAVRGLEAGLGRTHNYTAMALTTLAELRLRQGRVRESEELFREVIRTHEEVFGPDHRQMFESLAGLGELLESEGRWLPADSAFSRALAICRARMGDAHPCMDRAGPGYARVLTALGRGREADELRR